MTQHAGDRIPAFLERVRPVDHHTDRTGIQQPGKDIEVGPGWWNPVPHELHVCPAQAVTADLAILGSPAKKPPLVPTLLGMNTPSEANTFATEGGE